jgi:uncharacterized membrane protein YeaQ/YmgE (transglycosylase-associated protein family)
MVPHLMLTWILIGAVTGWFAGLVRKAPGGVPLINVIIGMAAGIAVGAVAPHLRSHFGAHALAMGGDALVVAAVAFVLFKLARRSV